MTEATISTPAVLYGNQREWERRMTSAMYPVNRLQESGILCVYTTEPEYLLDLSLFKYIILYLSTVKF